MLNNFSCFYLFFGLFFVYSCKENIKKKPTEVAVLDAVKEKIPENDGYDDAEKALLDYMPVLFWNRDSIAEGKHTHHYNEDGVENNPYKEKYEKFVLDTIVKYGKDLDNPISIDVEKGHIFDTNFVHLIVAKGYRRAVYCRNAFGNYFYHELIDHDKKYNQVINADLEIFIERDTIFDVNGDGYKDYALVLYSQTGCCRREVYRVYLYLPHCGGFTPYYEFMNPSFYPKQKIIRGVHYGHPGEVGIYEQKWDGVLVKTIQEIYPNWRDSINYTYLQFNGEGGIYGKPDKILKKLPSQFEHITSIDWFKEYAPKDFAEKIQEWKENNE